MNEDNVNTVSKRLECHTPDRMQPFSVRVTCHGFGACCPYALPFAKQKGGIEHDGSETKERSSDVRGNTKRLALNKPVTVSQ